MRVNFVNKSKIGNFEATIQKLFEYALKVLNIETKSLEVNIEFIKPRKMKKINKNYRGIKATTDVLSFPNLPLTSSQVGKLNEIIVAENFKFDINPVTQNIYLGEILINLKQIKKQAKQFGNTFERELGYIAVHGLLHLFGFDHMKESDKKKMRKYEELILEGCNLGRE